MAKRARRAVETETARQRELRAAGGKSSMHLNLGRLHGYLGFRLRRVQQRVSRRFSERTASFGFPNGGISALAIIEANPGVSQIAIAREIDVDASIAVGLINDLRRRALISRTRLADDRRRYAIRITAKGVEVLDRVFDIVAQTEDEVLRCLSPTEAMFLGRIFDKIYMQLSDPPLEQDLCHSGPDPASGNSQESARRP